MANLTVAMPEKRFIGRSLTPDPLRYGRVRATVAAVRDGTPPPVEAPWAVLSPAM